MRIQSSTGRVGIGTQTPAAKLDVAGDITFSGTLQYIGAPVLQLPGSLIAGNISLGYSALGSNSSGGANTASGSFALQDSTTGSSNTAFGFYALQSNTSGNNNTAIGEQALDSNTTGSNNIAIGIDAAQNVSGGKSNNIHIGSGGSSGDSATIRIGEAGTQTKFFVAGVRGITTGSNNAVPVLIDSNGQLGTTSSSRRYKEDIQDMGAASSDLMRLRPVTFRYQNPFDDGSKPIQYGLIAEEVAEVYPDLVARSADGRIETVKYQVLDSMLLNEVQRQQAEIRRLEQKIEHQNREDQNLQERLTRSFQERLAKLEAALASMSGAATVSGSR